MKGEERKIRKVKFHRKYMLPNEYWPELEESDELIPELASHYLQLIGILLWSVEIRRIDIFTEVSIM